MNTRFTRAGTKRVLKIFFISVIAIIIVGYAYYTSRNLVSGPSIEIISPTDGSSIASSTIEIIGEAVRIKEIKMNGRVITIDEVGNFKEYVVIFPGYNVITLIGKDQFGRTVEKKLQLMGI